MSRITVYQDGVLIADSGATVPPPPPPPPPDPIPPPSVGNYVDGTYLGRGNAFHIDLASGQVWCAPLPDTGSFGSGTIVVGEVPGSPQPRTIEICISKTKGLIDPAGNYVLVDQQANPSWLARAVQAGTPGRGGITIDVTNAKANGMMWAPAAEGPWFVNLRYTYPGARGQMETVWNNGPYP